jgi:bla regulator protein BlaR1
MALLANAIYSYGGMAGEVDKPVVDKTGLSGTFDFTIEYAPGENDRFVRPGPPNPDAPPPEPQGAAFLRAVRDQLGLKLVSSKGPIRTLVIDHVERPSEN